MFYSSGLVGVFGAVALVTDALAHPGHIVDGGAGHDHMFFAFLCIGIALVAAGVWPVLRRLWSLWR